jgi:Uma2 family endonuclease
VLDTLKRLASLTASGSITAGDLDRIPNLPPHTELIDGTLTFREPQSNFHTATVSLLAFGLSRSLPPDLRVRREMTVTLGRRQRPEPDVLVLHAAGVTGLQQNDFRPEDVVLVAEVVSPRSAVRDRMRKPQLYAAAGIPHFWRAENTGGRPTLHVHELDPVSGTYTLTGIHRDRLKLTVPFDIDIDLTEIEKL